MVSYITSANPQLTYPFTEALEGFDKPVSTPKAKEEKKECMEPENDVIWSEEFIKQASVEFEKSIKMMMAESGASGNDSEFAENLIKASQEAANKVFENQPDHGASFAETLRHLAENTESLQVIQTNCFPYTLY